MLRRYDIYFESNPLVESVLSKIKEYSGLGLEVLRGDSNVSLTHPTSPRHSIDLSFIKKGSYHGGEFIIERDYVSVDACTPEMNYLEGMALAVLKDLGGDTKLLGELPEWARSKWMGEKW